jgi:hypothetical protein
MAFYVLKKRTAATTSKRAGLATTSLKIIF